MPSIIKLIDKAAVKTGALSDVTAGKFTWADFTNPTNAELTAIRPVVGMTENELRELMRPSQRAMLYHLGKFTVIVFATMVSRDELLKTQPLVLFVPESRKFVLSIHPDPSTSLTKIASLGADGLRQLTRDSVIDLLVALCQETTDEFFEVADVLSDKIEDVEKRMFDYKHSSVVMKETLAVKKSLIYIHKGLVANREVAVAVQKEFGGQLSPVATEKLRDVSMDTTQLTEMITTYRDILTSAIEIHLTAISNNLNVIMKKVTSWGALILVPSLIAGIFGQNFRHIPTLDSPAGFYLSLVFMVVSVSLLAWFFKKRDWL